MITRFKASDIGPVLAALSKVVPARAANETLYGYHITAAQDRLVLRASNQQTHIQMTCQAVIEQPGEGVIPADLLNTLVQNARQDDISLTALDGGSRIEYQCGPTRSKISLYPAEHFPRLHLAEMSAIATGLDGARLEEALRSCAFCTSVGKGGVTSLVFQGIGLLVTEEQIELHAADGYRFTIATLPGEGQAFTPYEALVDAENIGALAPVIGALGQVDLYGDDRQLVVTNGATWVSFSLLAIEPRSYSSLVVDYADSKSPNRMRGVKGRDLCLFDPRELARGVHLVTSTMGGDKKDRVEIMLDEQGLLLFSEGAWGSSNDEVAATVEEMAEAKSADDLWVALSAKFLLEALRACPASQVQMESKGTLNHVQLRAPGWTHVIAPRNSKEVPQVETETD